MPTDQERITALEKQVADLKKQMAATFKVGLGQRSPVPGELIAGRITTPLAAGQPQMVLDLINQAAGTGPLLYVSDGTRQRVQLGNVAAYTDPNGVSSPAEEGLRVVDASGNLIFDSVGIAQVAKAVANYTMNNWSGTPVTNGSASGAANTPTGTGGEVTLGTTTSWTATRKTTYLFLAVAVGEALNGANGDLRQPFYVRVSGAAAPGGNSPAGSFPITTGQASNGTAMAFQVSTLSAGSYTLSAFWNSTVTTSTLALYALNVYVFQMGG